jgi:hypothetical protein
VTVAGTGLLAPTVVQSIGLSSLIVDRSVRQKASGNVIPTRKYREVLVTSRSLGVGTEGCSPGAFNDPSTCCNGSRFGSIFASIARPSKHGSHHVCDNRVPSARPPQGERLCLILRNLARQSNPTHGDGHWLALPARIGFIRLPISADSAAVPVSLWRESCYTVCAHRGCRV